MFRWKLADHIQLKCRTFRSTTTKNKIVVTIIKPNTQQSTTDGEQKIVRGEEYLNLYHIHTSYLTKKVRNQQKRNKIHFLINLNNAPLAHFPSVHPSSNNMIKNSGPWHYSTKADN